MLYFPDADEWEADDEDEATDIGWLACAIASIDVDILAVQEMKITDRSERKQRELITLLNARTGGDWKFELASCSPARVQHPGFLFDRSRVTGSEFREIPLLNPDEECSNRVSPGFAGYFSIVGGPDFHLVAVHMEAYPEKASLESREQSVERMGQVAQEAYAIIPDTDLIFAGDFNTTGCDECDREISPKDEVERIRGALPQLEPALRLVDASLECSKPGGSLLDHFVVDAQLAELSAGARAEVRGICQESNCSRLREWYERATERLSDHCPLTLDLAAADDD